MGRRLSTYPKASCLVQIPQKVLPRKTQSVLIPCPPHRIALLSKQDHWSKAEKMVCLKHRSLPHKSSPVWHKTEPPRNHSDKTRDKYKLPPPHPYPHRVDIRPDSQGYKTTASVNLFQWGDVLVSLNEKVSPATVPKGQTKAKHGPHHKAKHTWDSKQQNKPKLPPQHLPKNQATSLPFISQSGKTPPHCQSPTKYLLINTHPGPDCQSTPATPRLMNTDPGPDCQTTPATPRYEHHSKTSPDADAQDIPPPKIYHQVQIPLEKEEYGILPRLLSNQSKDPISQCYQKKNPPSPIQQTETTTQDYKQAEDASSSHQPAEAQPGSQHQTQTEQNRDNPRHLNDIKPYTIVGGITLTTQVVDKIIGSIPEEKIKRDLYNQVRLWQMRGCPKPTHWPGQFMSASYTICLICASWIPNGCPHVHEVKRPPLAQLLAIPTPLPNDSEKKNVRFYLRVPQQKPNTIPIVTDPLPTKAKPSGLKSDSVPQVLQKFTWLGFILARRHQPKEEKSCPGQKSFELSLTSKTNTEEEMPVRQSTQFKSLLEKFQSRRGN